MQAVLVVDAAAVTLCRSLDAFKSLEQRFRFYKQRNAPPLAYYFARRKHVAEIGRSDWRADYTVPEFLTLAWIGGKR